MDTRILGGGLEVSAIGLGCMGMSSSFPPFPDGQEMVQLLSTAVEDGVTCSPGAPACAEDVG